MKTEKHLSEGNIRLLIKILSGLSSAQQELAEQCINPFDPNKTYQKNQAVFHNDTLWLAKTVNNSEPSFDSTYWTAIDGTNWNEISAQDIENMLSEVSESTWDYMKTYIADDTISVLHGWSSSRTYQEVQDAIQTAKEYTLDQIAKSGTGSYVIANSTADVVDDKHLFLINNGTNYDIYVLVNSVATKIGDTSVNLDGLLDITTAEADYLKKADAEGVYAKIVDQHEHTNKDTLDTLTQEVVDKLVTTDVLGDYAKTTDLPTPRTDDEILAVINKEGLKFIDDANDTALTNGRYATKTTTTNLPVSAYGILTIDKYKDTNSTWIKQTYKPLADQIYVRSKINELDWTAWEIVITNKNETYKIKDYNNDLKVNNTIEKLEDLLKLVPRGETWYIPDFNIDQTPTDYGFPEGMQTWGSMTITNSISSGHYLIELQTNNNYQFYKRWIGETKNGTAGSNSAYQVNWKMCCMTSVADVPLTDVTFSNTTNYSVVSNSCKYVIKNGICTMMLYVNCVTPVTSWVTVTNVPKPSNISLAQMLISIDGTSMIRCVVGMDGTLQLNLGIAGTKYIATFSYPVAES